ncbi:MAG: BglG family transcription antiterminator LicT [Lachnospiraceae bacterium]
MKLFKSINNNIVSAFDDEGREVVVIGKGIGYKAIAGEDIPKEKIDKVYVMSSQDNIERLKELFLTIPPKYIELTDEILIYAKIHLRKKLNENAYFTLADHINFAVMRLRQGMNFQNVLLPEIRRFYSEEFAVGLYAVDLMKQRLGIQMPVDEAASIALHLYNAEYDITISEAFQVTKLLDRMLGIIHKKTGFKLDEKNYYGERFIVHLKFLAQRIIKNEILTSSDDEFYELLSLKYPKEMKCSEEIAAFIYNEYNFKLSREEVCNLTIHLRRVETE